MGAAITGLRPIVDLTFMDFITIALDAIVNNGAKNNYMFGGGLKTPVTFRVASGSGIGSAAQHSQSLESWLTHIPGIKVVAPGNANDAKGLLKSSIQDNNIVIFMEPKALMAKKKKLHKILISIFHLEKVKSNAKELTLLLSRMVVCWSVFLRRLKK